MHKTKIDLVDFDEISDMFDAYRELKIPFFPISVAEEIVLQVFLYSFIKDKDTVIVGMSGVGKSSLINNIFGCEVRRIADGRNGW